MSGGTLRLLQRLLVGSEERIARRWQARLMDPGARERRAFVREFAIRGRSDIPVGLLEGGGNWNLIGMPAERLISLRASIAGGTGTGKSSWLIGVLVALLRLDAYPVIIYDAKGETVDELLEHVIPYLLEHGLPDSFLDRLRVVRVFDRTNVPQLNLTLPQRGVPKEAQAFAVASAVEQALAEPLGGRMHHVLVRLVSLCIELRLPLTEVLRWLEDANGFQRAAARSADIALREYARQGFRAENKESLKALAARLNALLFWPDARLALCSPRALSFSEALSEPGLTLVHTGSPPAGAERLARFFGAALLGMIVRALLDREVRDDTPRALFAAEEIQESLGPEEARQLSRLLSTARFKREAVWLTNQSRSQLHAVDPGLVAAMRANVELNVQFRSNPEDAAAFEYMLPINRDGEAARRDLINSVARLPQRHCYLAVRDTGMTAQLVRAPRIDFEAMRASGRATPDETKERIRRGIVSMTRDQVPLVNVVDVTDAVDEVVDRPPLPEGTDEFPVLG